MVESNSCLDMIKLYVWNVDGVLDSYILIHDIICIHMCYMYVHIYNYIHMPLKYMRVYVYTYTSIHTCCLPKEYLREAVPWITLAHIEYGKIESRSPVIPPIFSQCIERFSIDDVSDNHTTNSPQKADQLSFQYLNTSISTPLFLRQRINSALVNSKKYEKVVSPTKKSGT